MKYCQIIDNKAHWVFESDTIPQFAPNIIIKDITDINPQPQEGWDYDEVTDTFTEPKVLPITPIAHQPTNQEIADNQLIIMGAIADIYSALPPTTTI